MPPFLEYISNFGKQYGTKEEFKFRMELFEQTDKFIKEWNAKEGITHTVSHNEFSDWTQDERAKLRGFRKEMVPEENEVRSSGEIKDLPASVNWTYAGAVNAVQNQGQCGSCWAFSAIGAIEGAHFIKTKDLVKLSEQQCVDCDD